MATLNDYRNVLINGIKLENARDLENASKLYKMVVQNVSITSDETDALKFFYGETIYDEDIMSYAKALDWMTVGICAAELYDLISIKTSASNPLGWAVVGVDVALNNSTKDVMDFFEFLVDDNKNVSVEHINIFTKAKIAFGNRVPFKLKSRYVNYALVNIIKGLVNNDISINVRENELV